MTESRLCSHCSYNLQGLTEPRCPECGQPFDPEDPNSYKSHPRFRGKKSLIVAACLLVIGLIFTRFGPTQQVRWIAFLALWLISITETLGALIVRSVRLREPSEPFEFGAIGLGVLSIAPSMIWAVEYARLVDVAPLRWLGSWIWDFALANIFLALAAVPASVLFLVLSMKSPRRPLYVLGGVSSIVASVQTCYLIYQLSAHG